jgi:DNA-binding Lrp family transcriptional regulator
VITSNEIRILTILADGHHVSQRRLAELSGLSDGMVNLLLRRLTKTGYIKIINLSRRKMRYLLTPKGISEKTNRSYQYLLRAVQTYRQIHDRIAEFVADQLAQGKTRFVVAGEGEIAELVKLVLRSQGDRIQFTAAGHTEELPATDGAVLIHCDINNEPVEGISVLEAVLKQSNQKPELNKGESYELV